MAGAGVTRCTSSFRIRPFLPLPATSASSTPLRCASSRAEGIARVSVTGVTVSSMTACGLRCANSCADVTVLPSLTIILLNTPSCGAGISRMTLSVSSSAITSSRFTCSPSCLHQVVSVPSVTDSGNTGTVISIIKCSPYYFCAPFMAEYLQTQQQEIRRFVVYVHAHTLSPELPLPGGLHTASKEC